MSVTVDGREESQNAGKGMIFGTRHIQVVLLFCLLTIAVGMRVQLSVAIVAMTDSTTSPNPDVPVYDWNNKSVVLSSFYWGYITLQLVAGTLGRLYGTKKFLLGAMFVNATACVLLPLIAEKLGSYGVMALRACQGISQGFFYPSVYTLLARWTPISERSRLGNIALSGYAFGAVITNPLVGFMSSTWLGWPSTFYLYGALGYLWAVLWLIYGASTPAEYKGIKKEEREYIEKSLGPQDDSEVNFKNIPFRHILTSIPVWALALANVGSGWALVTTGTETPTYLSEVMNFDMKSNSVLSSAPSVAQYLSGFLVAQVSDYMINHKYFTTGTTRKIFITFTQTGMAAALLILCFLPEGENTWSVMMLVMCGFFYGAVMAGASINQIDLSTRFAGVIMAITNTVANGVGLLAPIVVQVIVKDETDKSQWRIIFIITASLCLVTNVIYIIFGSGDLQPWDSYGQTEESARDSSSSDPRVRKSSRKISAVLVNAL